MIAVIDYGMGNVGSIINMLKKIGADALLAKNPEDIIKSDKIILPGVGSFDSGMNKLKKSGMYEEIKKHALVEKKPLLGICLGMQMLGRKSEEGVEEGLGFIPFDNIKFNFNGSKDIKIPHMGWDVTEINLKDDPIVKDLDSFQRYYFVHSYHAVCDNNENILMTCDYGYEFAAAVKNGNIYGFQFHPEKSHRFGMALLENFDKGI
jgi:glutamine amidotransferase